MEFIIGEHYTRGEIHAILGGEVQTYLPQCKGRIVAGCFDSNRNPDAPEEVQVGKGPGIIRKCRLLAKKRNNIPVFLKRGIHRWQYRGEYEFVEASNSSEEIEAAEAKSGRYGDVSCLLRLRPALAVRS